MMNNVDERELRRFLNYLMPLGKCVEVRAFNVVNTKGQDYASITGVFDNAGKLARMVKQIVKADAVYVTLNAVDSDRVTNKLERAQSGGAIGSDAITGRSLLLIDCDPHRLNSTTGQPLKDQKVSSTNAEHNAAIELCQTIACFLDANGWPEPLVADSGNGGHLLYAVDLPTQDNGLIRRVLQSLAAKFNTNGVRVDTAVFDPSRISKLYGTRACKGTETTDRPHRMSKILDAPESLLPVSIEQLELVAADVPKEPQPTPPQPSPLLGDRPGDIYNAQVAWDEILCPLGWKRGTTHVEDGREVTQWTRPGKSTGVSATTGYCSTDCPPDCFFSFSSATEIEPFEPRKSYAKFEAYALLNHDGDFSEAANALAEAGYAIADDLSSFDVINPPEVQLDEMPPSMDAAAFDSTLGKFILETDEFTEANKHARLLDMTVKAGNYFGRTAYVKIGDKRHYMNLFGVIVGRTGLGRKGETGSSSHAVFEYLPGDWQNGHVIPSISSGEGLIHRLKDAVPMKPKKRRGMYPTPPEEDEITFEIIDKRCLLESEELDNLLVAASRDGSTVSSIVRQGFDGMPLGQLKANTDVRATKYHFSIIGHVTPQELEAKLLTKEVFNGFANRFIWCPTRREKTINLFRVSVEERDRISEIKELHARACAAELEASADWLASLQDGDFDLAETEGIEIKFNQGASDLMASFNDDFNVYLEKTPFADLVVRGLVIVARMALLQAVLHRSETITARHIESAIAAWRFYQAGSEIIFAKMVRTDPLDALVEWIKAKGGRTTVRDVTKGPRAFRVSAKAQAALDELVNRNVGYWGEPEAIPGGGKAVVRFILGEKL